MNADSLKSDLQQVLESDVALRKEFNELKRSLSDYRNQLIMRDEDCKRLQVTIDVLNTKLLVMERDNASYRTELTSFKDLRDSISEQLESKQNEIDARLKEIRELRHELNSIATDYETSIDAMKRASELEMETVKASFSTQIEELKSNTHYREAGVREEFENKISEMSMHWADKEQSTMFRHEDDLENLREQQQQVIEALKLDYATQLSELGLTSNQEIANLQASQRNQLLALEQEWSERLNQVESTYQSEIETLKLSQDMLLNQTNSLHENKVTALINEYEDKLSNILIHSNSQNSKLNEELSKAQTDAFESAEKLIQLQKNNSLKSVEIEALNLQLNELKHDLVKGAEEHAGLNSDFEIFKQNASVSDNDKINELNVQINQLNDEISNMSFVFETATNELAENEKSLELKTAELLSAQTELDELKTKLAGFENNSTSKDEAIEIFKTEFLVTIQDEIHTREVAYQKLLSENTGLIQEVESNQSKVESMEAEMLVLQNELEQLRMRGIAKSEDFVETLALKQDELDMLEAVNKNLLEENKELKRELSMLEGQSHASITNEETLMLIESKVELESENQNLKTELGNMKQMVAELESNLKGLNEKNTAFETEISELKSAANTEEQEAFVDRLFKQIDGLNDQRLALLEEKDQMAGQLLKMNEVVGSLSQHVDNESIDVTDLNNHRKNVILANNSSGASDKLQMKEEINNLVREIDKCIALLSA